MRKIYLLQVVMSSLIIVGLPVLAEPAETPIIKLISQMADTPADHKALADYYLAKAETARAEIALHQSMKKSYAHRAGTAARGVDFNSSMTKHCDSLINAYQAAVDEYQSLADLHLKESNHH